MCSLAVDMDTFGHVTLALLPELGFKEHICVARRMRAKAARERGKGAQSAAFVKTSNLHV